MHEDELRDLISYDPETFAVNSRENSRLEFKESFSFGSMPRYAKTMMAFANAKGGYLAFGISDNPRIIIGLQDDRFDQIDPRRLTEFFNQHSSPELIWEFGSFTFDDRRVGFLFVAEAPQKPLICTRNAGQSDIIEGRIYYRYRGQSLEIKYSELRQIIEDRLELERRAWMKHIEKIASVGPTNVGIIDTIKGKIHGAGTPFLIDPNLLSQLKFIREGTFTESGGDPTLTLIGNVREAGPIVGIHEVPQAIHFEDIIIHFLQDTPMEPNVARAYLEECFRQNSQYIPIHHFRNLANASVDETLDINNLSPKSDLQKERFRERIDRTNIIEPVAVFEHNLPEVNEENYIERLGDSNSLKNYRSIILKILIDSPQTILADINVLAHARLLESITALSSDNINEHGEIYREILLELFQNHFNNFDSPQKSLFRKAVCRLDEAFNP